MAELEPKDTEQTTSKFKKISHICITAVITAAVCIPGTILVYSKYVESIPKRYYEQSRQRQIVCESGETVNVYIPEGFNDITENYNTLHKDSVGYKGDLDLRQNIVLGNGVDVPSSDITVYAEVYSSITHMYEQIYSDYSKDENLEETYSAVVAYHKDHEMTEKPGWLNLDIQELESFSASGVNFTLYKVSYDTDYTQYYDVSGNEIEDPEENIEHTDCLSVVSDTDDIMEITLYDTDKDNLVKDGTDFIKQFLMVNSTESK